MARNNKGRLYSELLKSEITNSTVDMYSEAGSSRYLRAAELQAYIEGLRKASELYKVCNGQNVISPELPSDKCVPTTGPDNPSENKAKQG